MSRGSRGRLGAAGRFTLVIPLAVILFLGSDVAWFSIQGPARAHAATRAMGTTDVQWDLAGLAYLPWAGIDGRYGTPTRAAMKIFKVDQCLSHDATPGPKAVAALRRAVTQVQAGAGVAQNGLFDPKTKTAVEAFQRAHRLTVTGQAGPPTMRAMGIVRVRCQKAAPSPTPEPSSPARLRPTSTTPPSTPVPTPRPKAGTPPGHGATSPGNGGGQPGHRGPRRAPRPGRTPVAGPAPQATPVRKPAARQTCRPLLQPNLAQDPALQPCYPAARPALRPTAGVTRSVGAGGTAATAGAAAPSGDAGAGVAQKVRLVASSGAGLPLLLGGVALLLGLALLLLARRTPRRGGRTRG